MISCIIPERNNLAEMTRLLPSLYANTVHPFELIVVHDACDGALCAYDMLRDYRRQKPVYLNLRSGFTRAVNIGAHLIDNASEFLCIMNSDIRVPKAWDEGLIGALRRNSDFACIVPLTAGSATMGNPLDIVKTVRRDINLADHATTDEMDAAAFAEHGVEAKPILKPMVPFFCAMIPCKAWRAVGPLDDWLCDMETTFGLGEDDDWCLRARKLGYHVGVAPNVYVWHQGGASFSKEHRAAVTQRQLDYLAAKYGVPKFTHDIVPWR